MLIKYIDKMKYLILFLFSFFQVIITKNSKEEMYNKLISQLEIIEDYKDSVFGLQLGANKPCEDNFFIQNITLLNKEGIIFSIFDGHGGGTLSKFANILLYPYFLEAFNMNKLERDFNKRIITSLKEAYKRIENEFLKISFNEHLKDNNKYTYLGSCALSAIIINKKIFIANLGDSKARLFFLDKNNIKDNSSSKFNVKKVSKVFNIRKKNEQKRMKKKYKDDEDIYRCYGEKSCYIKGILQPTRTFGDYTLKYVYFSLNDFRDESMIKQYEKFYQGPYISAKPDIKIYDLKDNFKYLILGSDGLWDVIKSRDMARLIYNFTEVNNKNNDFLNNKNYNYVEKISYGLINYALINYSKENNKNGDYNYILNTPLGEKRRNILDDITIITCDLSKYN